MIWYTEVLVVLTICNTIAIGLLFGFYFGIATTTHNSANNAVPVVCQCSGPSPTPSPGFDPLVEPAPHHSNRNLPYKKHKDASTSAPPPTCSPSSVDSEEMFAAAMLMGFYMGFHENSSSSSSLPHITTTTSFAAAADTTAGDAGIGVTISPFADSILLDISAQEFHFSLPAYTLEALKNTSSPQYKAYQWVMSDEQPKFATNPVLRMTQRFALGTIYFATDGESFTSWGQKHGWMNHNSNECEWFGCSCTSANIINSLKLHGNGHSGSLPKEIALLIDIELIHLWDNSFTGPIPTEVGLLTNLVQMGLDNNALTGPIPTELGLLTNLEVLDLYQNAFTGHIPTLLGLLTKLEGSLALSENKLVGTIPTELALLTKLKGLFLEQNELSGSIPTELSRLSDTLVELHLFSNALLDSVVPDGLEGVTVLERPDNIEPRYIE